MHANLEMIQRTATILKADSWSISVLGVVRDLDLPDWAIGAGFVRSLVWDHLSGNTQRTPLPDIDVVYFDRCDLSETPECRAEEKLKAVRPDLPWTVKNQARMHLRNNDRPYLDTNDALRFWLETPTAIAARLEADDGLSILAPLGLGDLYDMHVRPTEAALQKMEQYRSRMIDKKWTDKWPELKISGLE